MRILLVHEPYNVRGGEDQHVETLLEIYREMGFTVEIFPRSSKPKGLAGAIKSLSSSPSLRAKWENELTRFAPDLIHLHNIYPNLGPAFLRWLGTQKVPVWMTAHNHRFFCTNGLALREGRVCKDCKYSRNHFRSIAHNCNGNWHKSIYYSAALQIARGEHLFERAITHWLAPSPYMRSELLEQGIEAEKIHLVPHPLERSAVRAPETAAFDFFYAGRLSPEKGVLSLPSLAARLPQYRFGIAGDGPLLEQLRKASAGLTNVQLLSGLTRPEVLEKIAATRVGILPSICHESFSLFSMECFLAGKRVVVPNLDSTAWLATDPFFGLAADTNDLSSLALACERAIRLPFPTEEQTAALAALLGKQRFKAELGALLEKTRSPTL